MLSNEGPLDKEEEEKQTKQLDSMRKILEERMLRRRKEEVLSLPPLNQKVVWLTMTVSQQRWSKLIMFRNFEMASLFQKGRHLRKISSLYVKLRHICNHPYLLSRSEQAPEEEENDDELQTLINASCKLEWLGQKLPEIKERGQKVLIFTQTRLMLDLLERFLELREYHFLRLDGETPSAQRQSIVDKFNKSPQSFAFLLSTRAGGLGLNISSASTVIIYESDFNPHNDLQALSRAHRLGQTSSVTVFRLLCKDSVEEGIFRMARRKLYLQDLLTPSGSQAEQLNPESSAKSAYKAVTHEAAALFRSPPSSQKRVIEVNLQSEEASPSHEDAQQKSAEVDLVDKSVVEEKDSREEEKEEKGEPRQTQEWVQNFRRQYQEYKEGEAAQMGKGKRERKTRSSNFVSYEVLQFSDSEVSLLDDPNSDAFHLSASEQSPEMSQRKSKTRSSQASKRSVFQIFRLTTEQAERERSVYSEREKLKDQQRAAQEKQEKEMRAKQLAQIQAAIDQTNNKEKQTSPPPRILRPTPVYGSVSSPPAAPVVPGSAVNSITNLYHSQQSSFHAPSSPRSASNSRMRRMQDHPLMSELKKKANILTLYINKPFQEQRHIVGFPKKERLEFANLALCFGFSHSLGEWETIYGMIKMTPFLLQTFPLVRRFKVNEFQVYAITFALLIQGLSKLNANPFTFSHFMLGPHKLSKFIEAELQIGAFKRALALFSTDDSLLNEQDIAVKKKFYETNRFVPGWFHIHDIALLDAALHTGLSHINKLLYAGWGLLPGANETAIQKLSKLILGEGYEMDLKLDSGLLKKRVNQVVLDALIMRLKTISQFMMLE